MDTGIQVPNTQEEKKWIFFGIVISVFTAVWWNNELSTMLGQEVAKSSFACLLRAGTGDCGQLWFVGQHQTNQFASLLFYGGLLLAFYGFSIRAKFIFGLVVAGLFVLASFANNTSHSQPATNQQTRQIPIQQETPQAAYQERLRRTIEEVNAIITECRNKRLTGEYKTYVASANCSNPRIMETFQEAGYPYMDLVGQMVAERLKVAEKIDAGELTEGEGQLEAAKFLTHMTNIERQRNASR